MLSFLVQNMIGFDIISLASAEGIYHRELLG